MIFLLTILDNPLHVLGIIIGSILLLFLSGTMIAAPRAHWYISEGWKYKNIEPSDASLALITITGVIFIILILIVLILIFTGILPDFETLFF
ncbi:MAG: hypothetical protein GY810_23610 [Aureispira sp.]|nr:hypothetical protein [Aureispira sp.]